MFAKVYIDAAARAADRVYEYVIPPELTDIIKPAMRVSVPFGGGNKLSQAFVVSVEEKSEFDAEKLKYITDAIDAFPAVPDYLVKTAVFLRERYFCSYAEAIRCILPGADKLKKKVSFMLSDGANEDTFANVCLNKGVLSQEKAKELYSIFSKGKAYTITTLKNRAVLCSEELNGVLAILVKEGELTAEEEFINENKEQFDSYIALGSEDNSLDDFLMFVGKRAIKQREIVEYLFKAKEPVLKQKLLEETGASSASLKGLEENNLITTIYRSKQYFEAEKAIQPAESLPLTEEQDKALEKYLSLSMGSRFLLYGVTGSGKTRLFFEMFEDMLNKGKQCLLLVPEISLTPQMMRLVRGRFGDNAAIMHSKLTPAQRYSEFLKIRRGEAKIVLGARSALFMPFKALGLIVIDEQHETSYHSSNSPRYDTIETAEYIASLTGATLVLASATPATATYHAAKQGEYEILTLTKRVNGIPMPIVDTVDMRLELREGNRSPLSRLLQEKITNRLENHEQVLLFLNRRGYNTYVFCRNCGHIEMCPNCDVSLTVHSFSNTMRCHYCGYTKRTPHKCPKCGSEKIRFMGTGTEKIQQEVQNLYPNAKVMRLDSDTASGKDMYAKILGAFAKGEGDILVGTQMIVKGLDFDNVTLVGILLADSSLNFPDINAAARTFQLTAQAAGRAGRRSRQGEVVMQTYKPEAPTLAYAAQHDFEGFYAYDINYRMEMDYPPFSEVIGFFLSHMSEERCTQDSQLLYERIQKLLENCGESHTLYPPAPAFIQKIKNKHIRHVLVKVKAKSGINKLLRENYDEITKGMASYIYAEINPVTLL